MKYLKYYKDWASKGRVPDGLCLIFEDDKRFKLIEPNFDELHTLRVSNSPAMYWGRESFTQGIYDFTPLRQNIVLLMAAMAGEL